jgi:hypothetical protein
LPDSGNVCRRHRILASQILAKFAGTWPHTAGLQQYGRNLARSRRNRANLARFQKFLDFGTDQLSDSGDGRLFERECRLRHLEESRLRLLSGENDLRF